MKLIATIGARAVTPQRWRNGGGWTRELLTWPDSRHWQLRVSLATIESAGPFSDFAGTRRRIAIVDGPGVLLAVNGEIHRLSTDTEPLSFDGGASVHCTPIDGPTSDLNLITTRGEGEMLRAAPGIPWISPLNQRGLFARVAGSLISPPGWSEPVPARCLLWFEEAAGVAFSFAPDVADTSTPGWWLGYSG
ncbi:MAG TPA: HutD family protein [Steroidobacteraceae bacterium]|nr:HutD family protein [Steroidobacteraceae bacterium]